MALPKDFKTYRMYGAWKLHHMPGAEEPEADQGEGREGGDEPGDGEEQEGEEPEGGSEQEEDEGEGGEEEPSSPAA
jgi:hypothetical protein